MRFSIFFGYWWCWCGGDSTDAFYGFTVDWHFWWNLSFLLLLAQFYWCEWNFLVCVDFLCVFSTYLFCGFCTHVLKHGLLRIIWCSVCGSTMICMHVLMGRCARFWCLAIRDAVNSFRWIVCILCRSFQTIDAMLEMAERFSLPCCVVFAFDWQFFFYLSFRFCCIIQVKSK